MHCSKQEPEQQQPTDELSNVQPDVVYAHILPSQKPVTPDLENSNPRATPNDYEMNESVVYSELNPAAPSDLYAQVQK